MRRWPFYVVAMLVWAGLAAVIVNLTGGNWQYWVIMGAIVLHGACLNIAGGLSK